MLGRGLLVPEEVGEGGAAPRDPGPDGAVNTAAYTAAPVVSPIPLARDKAVEQVVALPKSGLPKSSGAGPALPAPGWPGGCVKGALCDRRHDQGPWR